jgi:tRNA pseudouridine38-40 synthase
MVWVGVIARIEAEFIRFACHVRIIPDRVYSSPAMAGPQQRYKLTIAYRGTKYHGWQHQAPNPLTWKGEWPPEGEGIPTVQEALTRAIGGVVNHPVTLVGSSRTDAGVHAKGQVAHFDTDQVQIPHEGLRRAVNARLPEDILIRAIEPVPETFHAIRSTTSKRYQYLVWTGRDRPVFSADLSWHRWQQIDVAAMATAAAALVGEHDFASFAKPGHERKTTVRTILGCDVSQRGPRLVVGIEGTGFLWNMVRIIVGTLVEVGLGRYAAADVARILEARDRRAAGGTAPAHGLYLQWIKSNLAHTAAKT